MQLCFVSQAVAGELHFQQSPGQRGGVDRCVDQLQHVLDCACMVFVAMGDDDPTHPMALVIQIMEIRDDVIDPQHIILWEHDARIDDENILTIFDRHHIFPDFPQPPEGKNSQLIAHFLTFLIS